MSADRGRDADAPVAINARAAVRTEIGGVERVARELADRLPALRPDRYRVIAPPPTLAHKAGQAWEQLALPVLARHNRLLFSPANLAPLASRRSVVMIHDVAPFLGDWYSPAYTRWHRAVLPRIAQRAQLVLTTSNLMRRQICEYLEVAPAKVLGFGLGVDDRFRAPIDPTRVTRQLGLDRPYVLAVGTDPPRKNLGLLDRIGPRLGSAGLDVVLAGSTRSYMPRGNYRIRSLGYVSETELPGLYAGAAALAMPSLYEGFGLPCVEAMASGTPVVTSNRGALPEVCGSAAIVVDPDDEEAFAAALLRAAAPGAERDRLVAAGRRHAATFTWTGAARQVDGHFSRLLGQGSQES